MSHDKPSLPTGDSSSDIFGQSAAQSDHGRTWPLPDSAVGVDSQSAGQYDDLEHETQPQEQSLSEDVETLAGSFEWSADPSPAQPVEPDKSILAEESPAVAFAPAAADPSPPSGSTSEAASARARKQSLLVIGLVSYASAATLALLYLFFALSRPRTHALESLPDVPPLDVKRGEVMQLAPPDADLPPGHELQLGESRRFGNLLVEPLHVVAEPVEFKHFSGRAMPGKPPTPPVLKLWIRFTNVSDHQQIAPLDAELMFRRAVMSDGQTRANQFVCRASDRASPDALVLLYDHPATSEWDMTGQQLGRRLAPGESMETYLPSAAQAATLDGPLIWRVHFRKGYSPRGFGVTTLVDVHFDSASIHTPDAAAG